MMVLVLVQLISLLVTVAPESKLRTASSGIRDFSLAFPRRNFGIRAVQLLYLRSDVECVVEIKALKSLSVNCRRLVSRVET